MTTDTVPEKPPAQKTKKSLLEKYDIPLAHLEFAYIKNCCNILEIERIVRILRSGEEGHYPELLQCAEKRLKLLCPDSKILRTCEPVMTKSCLDPDEWASVHKEIMEWKQEIDDTDEILNKNKNNPDSSNFYPEVRRPVKKSENEEEKKDKVEKKKISTTDYNKWDKFDADKECLKLDLEEEKRNEEKQRRELSEKKKEEAQSKLSLEEKEIELISQTAESLTAEERKILAVKEKELGNEYYKGNLFNEALKHYTRSIYLHPTPTSYNNRAATYLKQCRFSKAQEDLDIVLELEPENVKAHFRRALTLQHKNEFEKALDDILFVLKRQPNHVIAKHIANELRENCCKLPKTHRLRIKDENNPKKVVYTEVSDEEFKQKYKDKKNFVEVNQFNLPKVMCNCNGKHTHDPQMCSNDPLRYQQIRTRYGQKANEKIAEMERASRMLKAAGGNRMNNPSKNLISEPVSKPKPLIQSADISENKPTVAGGRRLDIMELEKILEEEMTSKIQGTHLNTMKDSSVGEAPHPKVITSCLVTDRRTVKTPKVYFGNYLEEDTEEGKQEEAAALITDMEVGDHIPKTKEEKMNLNINIKEALDIGGGGDAPMDEEMIVDESPLPSESIKFSGPPPLSSICMSGSSALKFNGMFCEESTLNSPMTNHEQPQVVAAVDKMMVCQENSPSKDVNDLTSIEPMTDEKHSQLVTSVDGSPIKGPKEDLEKLANEVFPNETLRLCDCREGFQLWPSQFEAKWFSYEKFPNVVEERSKLIRLVCPHRLSSVMSNTLNVELLSGFIDCLSEHFDPTVEGDKVKSYLTSIANLQRFKIIYLFLSKESRENVITLLQKLGPISPALEQSFL